MVQLIDKSTVVAEIKKGIANYKKILISIDKKGDDWVDSMSMLETKVDVLQHILFSLNTLEVKEVEEEPISNDLEEAAINRVTENGKFSIEEYEKTRIDDIIFGAKWHHEKMMKDAVETTVKIDAGGYPYIDRVIELYDYNKDEPLAKKGDKVKLIIIKEE